MEDIRIIGVCEGAWTTRPCEGEVEFVPCPYYSNVYDDQTPVWLCKAHWYERSRDV